jgi:hypothetical protein
MTMTELSESHQSALGIAARWAAPPPAQDAAQIQNLLQVYALYGDGGRVDELASLFTEDAFWDGHELDYGVAEGPAAIAARVAGHFKPEAPMMHMPGPALLAGVSANTVQSVCWCLATRWNDGVPIPLIHFSYNDELRRGLDGVWRFRRRYLRRIVPKPGSSG